MDSNALINPSVFHEIVSYLGKIEQNNDVIVLHAIESGSRAWGFPSPNSDYDVRFIYVHPKDWYLQLSDERDVIEHPINDELDIAGWDLQKALKLANKGNAVVQEWIRSPIIYKQSDSFTQLSELVHKTFNPISTYYHYRSMAKKAYFDITQTKQKKLKRFFYFARATLSAKWVLENHTMPSIIFSNLIADLIHDSNMSQHIQALVNLKAKQPENSLLEVPPTIYRQFEDMFLSLDEYVYFDSIAIPASNADFQRFLNRN